MHIRQAAGTAIGLIGIGLLGWLILGHAGTTGPVNGDRLEVVAAENFWGDIARQIGGQHVHVTSIVSDPAADPHLYESDARAAAAVTSAKVVIVNGLGYDDFMTKLLQAAGGRQRQVVTAAQTLQVRGTAANPHLWYDIPRLNQVAAQIAAAYETQDPAHTTDYQHNLHDFDTSLQPLLNTLATIKQHYSGAPVAYTERVPGYLLATAGLDIKTPPGFAQAVEDGTDPSPAETVAMDMLVSSRQVRVLLYNAQATSPVTEHVRQLAQQAGVPVIGVTETMPANAASYQTWQQAQLNELLKALRAA